MNRRGFLGRLFGAVAGASVAGKVVAETKLEAVQKPFTMGVAFRADEVRALTGVSEAPMAFGGVLIARMRELAKSLGCFHKIDCYEQMPDYGPANVGVPVIQEKLRATLAVSLGDSCRQYGIAADSQKNTLSCLCTEPHGAWNMSGMFSMESWEKIEKEIRRVEGKSWPVIDNATFVWADGLPTIPYATAGG